jgi:hypothetical protein
MKKVKVYDLKAYFKKEYPDKQLFLDFNKTAIVVGLKGL